VQRLHVGVGADADAEDGHAPGGLDFSDPRGRGGEGRAVGRRAVGQHEQPGPVVLQARLPVGLLLPGQQVKSQVQRSAQRRPAARRQLPRHQVPALGERDLDPRRAAEGDDREYVTSTGSPSLRAVGGAVLGGQAQSRLAGAADGETVTVTVAPALIRAAATSLAAASGSPTVITTGPYSAPSTRSFDAFSP